jgi:plastocyanin
MTAPPGRALAAAALAACTAASALTRPARAQGSVSGQVSLLERVDAGVHDLATAVVYLEPADGATGSLPAVRDARIAMSSREFVPRVQVVTVGSEVGFPNLDAFRHNVFSNTGPTVFDLALYGRGKSRSATFARPGVHPIFCNIHARMSAYVLAVPTALYAQPGADGRFAIAHVPAGRYTLRVWHERGGEQARPVEVPAAGVAGLALQLDARGHRPTAHKNKFGQDYGVPGRDRY